MAAVPVTNFSLATIDPDNTHRVVGCNAGEAITRGQAVTGRADSLLYKAVNTDQFLGVAMTDVVAGEPLTLMHGVVVRADHGLTPFTKIYQSTTAGAFDTTVPASGNTAPVGIALPDNRLLIYGIR